MKPKKSSTHPTTKAMAAMRMARMASADLDCLMAVSAGDHVRVHYRNDTTQTHADLITFAVKHEARIEVGYFDDFRVVYILSPAKKGGFKL